MWDSVMRVIRQVLLRLAHLCRSLDSDVSGSQLPGHNVRFYVRIDDWRAFAMSYPDTMSASMSG